MGNLVQVFFGDNPVQWVFHRTVKPFNVDTFKILSTSQIHVWTLSCLPKKWPIVANSALNLNSKVKTDRWVPVVFPVKEFHCSYYCWPIAQFLYDKLIFFLSTALDNFGHLSTKDKSIVMTFPFKRVSSLLQPKETSNTEELHISPVEGNYYLLSILWLDLFIC